MREKVLVENWNVDLQIVWGHEPKSAGWRRRLGRALRRVADRIDGRWSWAVHLRANPPLSREAMLDCFKQGAIAIDRAAIAECRIEASERLLRRAKPSIFAETKQ